MAAKAGEKQSVSLSLLMEGNNVEVEEELSTMATVAWAEGVWLGKWGKEHQNAWTRERICRSRHARDS